MNQEIDASCNHQRLAEPEEILLPEMNQGIFIPCNPFDGATPVCALDLR